MKCPLCNTEMRIESSEYVVNNNQIFAKQTLTCRNKNCANFGKAVKIIYNPLGNIQEDSNAEAENEQPEEVVNEPEEVEEA